MFFYDHISCTPTIRIFSNFLISGSKTGTQLGHSISFIWSWTQSHIAKCSSSQIVLWCLFATLGRVRLLPKPCSTMQTGLFTFIDQVLNRTSNHACRQPSSCLLPVRDMRPCLWSPRFIRSCRQVQITISSSYIYLNHDKPFMVIPTGRLQYYKICDSIYVLLLAVTKDY